jgi:hypothetical protein
METNILRTVDPGEETRSHAGIVMIRGRPDKSDTVAALDIFGKFQENGEVGVTATD